VNACPQCGAENDPTARYCDQCACELGAAPVPATPSEVPGLRITIGRDPNSNNICVERGRNQVSRNHAEVVIDENGQMTIFDLQSSNGVKINQNRISGPTPVQLTDTVELGSYMFNMARLQPYLSGAALPPPPSEILAKDDWVPEMTYVVDGIEPVAPSQDNSMVWLFLFFVGFLILLKL
jgi:hypothetical protein